MCLLRKDIIVWYLVLGCCLLLLLLLLASLPDGFAAAASSLLSAASFSSTCSCCFSRLILYDTARAWMSVFPAEFVFWSGGTATSASSDVTSTSREQLLVLACVSALPGSV